MLNVGCNFIFSFIAIGIQFIFLSFYPQNSNPGSPNNFFLNLQFLTTVYKTAIGLPIFDTYLIKIAGFVYFIKIQKLILGFLGHIEVDFQHFSK